MLPLPAHPSLCGLHMADTSIHICMVSFLVLPWVYPAWDRRELFHPSCMRSMWRPCVRLKMYAVLLSPCIYLLGHDHSVHPRAPLPSRTLTHSAPVVHRSSTATFLCKCHKRCLLESGPAFSVVVSLHAEESFRHLNRLNSVCALMIGLLSYSLRWWSRGTSPESLRDSDSASCCVVLCTCLRFVARPSRFDSFELLTDWYEWCVVLSGTFLMPS